MADQNKIMSGRLPDELLSALAIECVAGLDPAVWRTREAINTGQKAEAFV